MKPEADISEITETLGFSKMKVLIVLELYLFATKAVSYSLIFN
jgi:hypothetical protein